MPPKVRESPTEIDDFKAGKMRWVTWRTMEAVVGMKPSQRAFVEKYCPGFPPAVGGKLDGIEACEMLSKITSTGNTISNMRHSAIEVLKAWREANTSPAKPSLVKPAPAHPIITLDVEDIPEAPAIDLTDIGAAAALRRLRSTEQTLHTMFMQLVIAKDPGATAVMRQWKDVIDQLRKMESEILDIEKSSGSLVEASEMKRYVSSFVMPIKSKLLAMPAQIAEELVGRDTIEITEILTLEMRKILTELAQWKPE